MAPIARKRSNFSTSKETISESLSAPKRRKKIIDSEKQEKQLAHNKKKSVLDSPIKSKTHVAASQKEFNEHKINCKRSLKAVKKTNLTVEKPSVPVHEMNVEQLLALGENSHLNDLHSSEGNDFKESDNSDLYEYEGSNESDVNDFEEVKHSKITEPIIPKEGVDVFLESQSLFDKSRKRTLDVEGHLKRQLNKVRKDLQLLMHKVHVLCWIAHLRFVNNVCNDSAVLESCISLVKSKNLYPLKRTDLIYLEGILKWFHKTIVFKKDFENSECTGGLVKELSYQFEHREAYSFRAFILMFIILLRTLGLKARIVMSFQVLPLKPSLLELYGDVIKKRSEKLKQSKNAQGTSKIEEFDKEGKSQKCEIQEEKTLSNKKLLDSDISNKAESKKKGKKIKEREVKVKPENSDTEFESKHFKPSLKSQKKQKLTKSLGENVKNQDKGKLEKSSKNKNSIFTDSDEDQDFTFVSLKKKVTKKTCKKSANENKESQKKKEGIDIWTEVYLESEEKWIGVDVPRQKIHCVGELYSRATHPVVYVIACNNNLTLKDVTKRYVPNWHSDTRKKRVDDEWWNETIKPYLPAKSVQDKEEDEDINQLLLDKPLPSSISEFKNHPLYVLRRHLLKFEAIYPPDAPTLGFVRGEPVYARECVTTLHSREMWYKQARVVRLKEMPYKIVKARPKYDKMTGEIKKDLPLELFGKWQTEDYIPPIATGGKVPRNEYGNVDLFKPCMLPIGTVYLQIPGLIKIAKKLDIDCAPATVGFDFHSGGSHPVFDGFIVCEEFKETLLDAWNKEVDESIKKEEEKKNKRVYNNWKRLIRGLLIREKLKIKYAFGEQSDEEEHLKSLNSSKTSP